MVELFTSQGCSSCPPANAFLNELSKQRSDVLALAFHVTYWDYLGWKDPFSMQTATDRQARYGQRFGDGSYTPEIVVPRDLAGDSGTKKAARKAQSRRPQKHAKTTADDAADRKAAQAFEKEQARRERERAREQEAQRKQRERRQKDVDKAQSALDAARQRHDQDAAGIQAKIEDLEEQSRAEEARWGKERSKLEAALRRARG